MPTDPGARFDEAVLEMIERSPTGAVPVTPAYQDALGRLRAAHQVYPHADHPDGHVTARSLARLPRFHAANLGELEAGRIDAGALEPNAAVFERYVASLPAALRARAEAHRARLLGRPVHHRARHAGAERMPAARDPVHALFLVAGSGPHPGLPGNYLYGSLLEVGAGAPGAWAIQLHDREDGVCAFDAPALDAALAKLEEVLACSPFCMDELLALGFRMA